MNYIFCDVQQQQSHMKLKSPHVALVVGLLQVCSPAAQEQKQAAKSGVFSYELMHRKSGGNPDSLHQESRVSSVDHECQCDG